jgi:hypothetical protein
MSKKVITICSSANFYKEVMDIKAQVEKLGYTCLVPKLAHQMQVSNDYDVSHYKTWWGDPNDYHKKAALMHGHFDEVAKADAILVVNNTKHGVPNYIGGNVLMEMALAFHLNEKIFILNDIPEESSFLEEIKGLGSIPLHGDLRKLTV